MRDQPHQRVVLFAGLLIATGLLSGEGQAQDQGNEVASVDTPDHVSMTNSKIGGSPKQPQPAKLQAKADQSPAQRALEVLAQAGAAQTQEQLQALLRDQRLIAPDQPIGIAVDENGGRTLTFVTPDKVPVVIKLDR